MNMPRKTLIVEVNSEIIVWARKKAKKSVEEVAKKLKMSIKEYEKIERGSKFLTYKQLEKLAQILNTNMNVFFLSEIPKMPKRYIMNSVVITNPGLYEYKLISIEDTRKWLEEGDYISTISYQETAEAFEILTGIRVPINRMQIRMEEGDEALVFRLTCRLDNPALKGHIGEKFILNNCEIGILKRREVNE